MEAKPEEDDPESLNTHHENLAIVDITDDAMVADKLDFINK